MIITYESHIVDQGPQDIVESLAVGFLGYKWIAYMSSVHNRPAARQKCMVRRLMSPSMLAHPQWIEFFKHVENRDSDGTEPLSRDSHLLVGIDGLDAFCEKCENAVRERGQWNDFMQKLQAEEWMVDEKLRPHITPVRVILNALHKML